MPLRSRTVRSSDPSTHDVRSLLWEEICMKSGARARGGFARAVCVGIALSLGGACSGQDAKKSETATIATPTPARLADGAPNWTGFWIPVGGLLETVVATNPAAPKSLPPVTAVNVKSDDPAALALMKSPYKELYAELLRKEALGEPAYDPTALCFPPGMPRMMNMTYGMELLQTPGQIAITSEWGPATRRIWLDGRVHPPQDDLEFTYAGESIGRWEGNVLLVETVGLRTDALLNKSGLMHSEKLRLVERFSMPQPGLLLDEITVEDPIIFTAPWKIRRLYRYRPDLSLKEYVCQDNNNLMAIKCRADTPAPCASQ